MIHLFHDISIYVIHHVAKLSKLFIIIIHLSFFHLLYPFIWVNHNISLTWIVRPAMGMIPHHLTIIPSAGAQWGRYNSPRFIIHHYLVGGFNPSEKYKSLVSWDDYSTYYGTIKFMFQTTNQYSTSSSKNPSRWQHLFEAGRHCCPDTATTGDSSGQVSLGGRHHP